MNAKSTLKLTGYIYPVIISCFLLSMNTVAQNIALNKPATASSVQDASLPAGNAVDGNAATRWSSAYADPQWIRIDLGATYNITRVVLKWETAYGKSYQVQVSANGTTWASIFSTTTGNGATDDLTGLSGSGRYIRMNGTQRATAWGYSLFEFEVYGTLPGGGGGGFDLTGYTLFRDYNFGTAAANNVKNISNLTTNFNPYAIAGTTVINGEWQRYQPFNTTNHVFATNDLEITATPNLGGISNGGISSGQIATKETFYPRNGRTYVFQVRAKIPRGQGSWPAFWMYAKADPHTASEIDIFEFFNSATQNTFDWTGYDHGDGVGSNYHNIMTNQWVWHPGFDFAADYHTYTLVWKLGDIQKWVDNNWVKGTNFTWNGSDPQVIINLALGGNGNLNPVSSTFPCKFLVDYFRVYYKDGTGLAARSASPAEKKITADAETIRDDNFIYPNPASAKVNIPISAEFLKGQITLYDLNGKKILVKNISNTVETLDTRNLPVGTYVVAIQHNAILIHKKLVIKRQ